MTTKRPSPEMAARLEAVRAAKAKLQDKHFVWIIDAALEHYVAEAKKVETEIVRYQTLSDLPLFSKFGRIGPVTAPATRESELPRLCACTRSRDRELTALSHCVGPFFAS